MQRQWAGRKEARLWATSAITATTRPDWGPRVPRSAVRPPGDPGCPHFSGSYTGLSLCWARVPVSSSRREACVHTASWGRPTGALVSRVRACMLTLAPSSSKPCLADGAGRELPGSPRRHETTHVHRGLPAPMAWSTHHVGEDGLPPGLTQGEQ